MKKSPSTADTGPGRTAFTVTPCPPLFRQSSRPPPEHVPPCVHSRSPPRLRSPATALAPSLKLVFAKEIPRAEPYGQQLPGLSPHLTVNDAAAAIDFYKRAFGATELARHHTPDGKRIMHAALSLNGGMLMLNDDFPEYHGVKASTPRRFRRLLQQVFEVGRVPTKGISRFHQ